MSEFTLNELLEGETRTYEQDAAKRRILHRELWAAEPMTPWERFTGEEVLA
jgi:hypothetical protein